MKNILALIFFLAPLSSYADWFFDPHAAVGYNPAQGTHFRFGLDLGMRLDENLSFGVGAYYSAGEQPSHDREIGAGPFISYVQPLTSFLMASARQELNYVDLRYPIETVTASGSSYSHTEESGVASATSVALHIFLSRHFVLSGGYRFVLGLTNEALDDDRSGAFAGFAFGI